MRGLIILALNSLFLLFYGFAGAAFSQNNVQFRIVGDLSAETIAPLTDGIALSFSDIEINYRQISPGEWTSRLLSSSPSAGDADLVILSTPDLAVMIANEGGALRYDAPLRNSTKSEQLQWRNELFSIGFDPAALIIRRKALANAAQPNTRIELARLLEQNASIFNGRAGLVNIGLDNVSYTLAAQDSIRSPLFWRIARAFGVSQARIFDDNEELLQALTNDRIDLAYNVPLSDIRKWHHDDEDFALILPQDYVVALPWTALIPVASKHPVIAEMAIDYVMAAEGQKIVQNIGLISIDGLQQRPSVQPIEPGPELLVYLDSLKRSRFLDTWFQLVIHE